MEDGLAIDRYEIVKTHRKNGIRNDKIREILKKRQLNKLKENKIKWFGHLVRMSEERPEKLVW